MKHCRRRTVFDNRENSFPQWARGGVGGAGGGDWDGDGGGGGNDCRQTVKKHDHEGRIFNKC